MGQGKSFPWLSSATGRPAIEETSTVETTGKGCCAATMVAHIKQVSSILAGLTINFLVDIATSKNGFVGFSRLKSFQSAHK
jgi:hypothetical protein